jgi:RNA polymerase sigma factor (sigma-70 family)
VVVNTSREAVEMTGSEAAEARSGPTAAAAFQTLADEHLDAAYRLARVILRDPSEAQDATHDAFVQAWRKWSTLRDPDRFEAWFDRILVNACKDRLRRTSRHVARDISEELGLATADPYTRTHERDAIDQALATLSPDHRVVVAMRFDRDLAADEIARRLAIPVGTVHSRLHYALRQLHEVIDGFELEGTAR